MTDREFDELISQSLATYVAEPGPQLERRVLAHLRRSPVLRWMALGIAAAIVLVFAVPREPRPVAREAASLPAPMASKPQPPVPVVTRAAHRLPRAIQTGVPMSAQERRLVRFVRAYPELFAEGTARLNQPLVTQPLITEPLVTQPIVIEPLEPLTVAAN